MIIIDNNSFPVKATVPKAVITWQNIFISIPWPNISRHPLHILLSHCNLPNNPETKSIIHWLVSSLNFSLDKCSAIVVIIILAIATRSLSWTMSVQECHKSSVNYLSTGKNCNCYDYHKYYYFVQSDLWHVFTHTAQLHSSIHNIHCHNLRKTAIYEWPLGVLCLLTKKKPVVFMHNNEGASVICFVKKTMPFSLLIGWDCDVDCRWKGFILSKDEMQ